MLYNITKGDTWGNNGHCANQQYYHNTFVCSRTCSNGYVNIQPLTTSEILSADLSVFQGQAVELFFFKFAFSMRILYVLNMLLVFASCAP